MFTTRSEFNKNSDFQEFLFQQLVTIVERKEAEDFSITDPALYYNIVKLILKNIGLHVDDIEDHVSFEILDEELIIRNRFFKSVKISKEFDIPNIIMTLLYEVLVSLEESQELKVNDNSIDEFYTIQFKLIFNIDFLKDILSNFGNNNMDCSKFDHKLGTPYRLTKPEIEHFRFPAYKMFDEHLINGLRQSPLSVLDFGSGNCEVAKHMKSKTENKFYTFDGKNSDADFSETKYVDIGKCQMTVIWPPPLDCEDDDCEGCFRCIYSIRNYGGVNKFWEDFEAIICDHDVKTIHIVMSSKSSGCKNFRRLVNGGQSTIKGKTYDCTHIQSYVYFPHHHDPEIVSYYVLYESN